MVEFVKNGPADPEELGTKLLADVRARPRAMLDRSRQLLALWFNAASPAAPVDPAKLKDLPAQSFAQPVIKPPKTPEAAN